MALSLTPTYIPLKHAVRKYGIAEKTLLDQIKSGSIATGQLPDGELLVAERDLNTNLDPSLQIRQEDFVNLQRQPISISEASRKYSSEHVFIPPQNFSRWAKSGHIKILERGWKVLLNEADVAYCAAIYKAKYEFYGGQLAGVPIFDENGKPYRLKHSDTAAYKRSLRKRQRLNR